MTSDIRTCPVCEHRQKRDDPSRHVCAQVLRQRLREADLRLEAIRAVTGHEDPVSGAKELRRIAEFATRTLPARVAAAQRVGRKEAIDMLCRSIAGAPWWKRILLRGQYQLLLTLRPSKADWHATLLWDE